MFHAQVLLDISLATISYALFVQIKRWKIWYELENATEPTDVRSAFSIFVNFGQIEFPLLSTKALEFGLFKTYAIPSISKILVKTKQLTEEYSRRYDDTDLIIREFTENEPNSNRHILAIMRLNFLHDRYKISNEDYLYVLSVFIVEPVRWVNQFAYRSVHPYEKKSLFIIWEDIGKKMGIKNIPPSFDAVVTYLDNYEAEYMKYDANNVALASSTTSLFLSKLPTSLHPLGKCIIECFCSPQLRDAMGFATTPSFIVKYLSVGFLHGMALWVRFFCLPRITHLRRTSRSLPQETMQTESLVDDLVGGK